ncbi:MAG: hypothetical protein COB93_09475, partial [Sneathiella sp.]
MKTFLAILSILLFSVPVTAGEMFPPVTVEVPAGLFLVGSDRQEKEYGYWLDEQAYGHSVTRQNKWYENEVARQPVDLPGFHISKTPVTNAQYAAFIAATGHPAPTVDQVTWQSYGLIHPYERTLKFQWLEGRPPKGRADHPVVLISHKSAEAYVRWLSRETGDKWRLPTAAEWEKAARGTNGNAFPWGSKFAPDKLNSHDNGPFETTAVGQYETGASPFGMLDAAGQV